MTPPAISGRRVCVQAGNVMLLEDIDIDVAAGEVVSLVGPNGAGKSTLIAAIAGDRELARGTVMLHGRNVAKCSIAELARLRAVLAQRSHLSLAFTALEVVQLAGPAIDHRLARRCLADVGLEAFAERTYPSLSGGEQQRVQLARVLAQLAIASRAALLLDEPTSALDPRHQQLVLALARRAARAGHPVVVVLHDLTLAARVSDRTVLLAKGRVVAHGPPAEVLTPDHLDTAYAVHFEILRGEAGMIVVSR
jgi:iron complex transport system ATP-binding protein